MNATKTTTQQQRLANWLKMYVEGYGMPQDVFGFMDAFEDATHLPISQRTVCTSGIADDRNSLKHEDFVAAMNIARRT